MYNIIWVISKPSENDQHSVYLTSINQNEVCGSTGASPTFPKDTLEHKGPVWLQVFVPTSQEHTVWPINSLKTEISWLNESGLVCCCLAGTKTCAHTGPLWTSLDMPALDPYLLLRVDWELIWQVGVQLLPPSYMCHHTSIKGELFVQQGNDSFNGDPI